MNVVLHLLATCKHYRKKFYFGGIKFFIIIVIQVYHIIQRYITGQP